ncbi:MAG: hypothetical protein LQ348_000798 [Seirophora lacunosa]|nr:MAG: hypothetical protein LQ348_000798 [Seirophora lacunosa]
MPRPKRHLLATAQETLTPPPSLDENHAIAKVRKAEGKNLYSVELPSSSSHTEEEKEEALLLLLVELPSRFRSQIWLKRGGYVVVDTAAFAGRDNKLDGEIVNVVRDEREWRKQAYWPAEFVKKSSYPEDSDEESHVGQLPPSDDSNDET